MKSHHPHTFQITKYVFCSRIVFPRDARVNDKIVCRACRGRDKSIEVFELKGFPREINTRGSFASVPGPDCRPRESMSR